MLSIVGGTSVPSADFISHFCFLSSLNPVLTPTTMLCLGFWRTNNFHHWCRMLRFWCLSMCAWCFLSWSHHVILGANFLWKVHVCVFFTKVECDCEDYEYAMSLLCAFWEHGCSCTLLIADAIKINCCPESRCMVLPEVRCTRGYFWCGCFFWKRQQPQKAVLQNRCHSRLCCFSPCNACNVAVWSLRFVNVIVLRLSAVF